MRLSFRQLSVISSLSLAACAGPPPRPYYEVEVRKLSDTGIDLTLAPELHPGDFVRIDRGWYSRNQPRHGDLILFRDKKEPTRRLIRKVIALPMERVEAVGGVVKVNGDARQNPNQAPHVQEAGSVGGELLLVKPDHYYVEAVSLPGVAATPPLVSVRNEIPIDLIIGKVSKLE